MFCDRCCGMLGLRLLSTVVCDSCWHHQLVVIHACSGCISIGYLGHTHGVVAARIYVYMCRSTWNLCMGARTAQEAEHVCASGCANVFLVSRSWMGGFAECLPVSQILFHCHHAHTQASPSPLRLLLCTHDSDCSVCYPAGACLASPHAGGISVVEGAGHSISLLHVDQPMPVCMCWLA